jgi:mersacidin/lichenicidin family type 2 lantibiotic
MTRDQIIRAWKDADYRESLGESERSMLPEHPAGLIRLDDEELESAAGGETLFGLDFCGSIFNCQNTMIRGTCYLASTFGCCPDNLKAIV